MAKEPTYFERMIASVLAYKLRKDIEALEDPECNGYGTFFSTASTVMNRGDLQKLVKAAKAQLKVLDKTADGMPARVVEWRLFIKAEGDAIAEQDRLLDAKFAHKMKLAQRNNP